MEWSDQKQARPSLKFGRYNTYSWNIIGKSHSFSNTNADIPTHVSVSFKDFDELYTEIGQNHPTEEYASGFFEKVMFKYHEWLPWNNYRKP